MMALCVQVGDGAIGTTLYRKPLLGTAMHERLVNCENPVPVLVGNGAERTE